MEKNIDYRLDLFNAVEKFSDNMNDENDAIFIISKSTHGDNFSALLGNIDLLQFMLSRFDALENPTNEQIENFNSMQDFVLNSAFSILLRNDKKRELFINSLNQQAVR